MYESRSRRARRSNGGHGVGIAVAPARTAAIRVVLISALWGSLASALRVPRVPTLCDSLAAALRFPLVLAIWGSLASALRFPLLPALCDSLAAALRRPVGAPLAIGLLASTAALGGPISGDNAKAAGNTIAANTSAPAPSNSELLTSQPFTDRRNPPAYRKLSDAEFARYDLGMAVFNTQFVVAGTPNAGRRDGVGPLFNSSSCDACHNNGARGRGPTGDGPAPDSLVIQLAAANAKNRNDPEGDPVYGRVLNPIALEGVPPEGVVVIHYEAREGHYPDGTTWNLRVPHYELTKLHYGPVARGTIVKPRLAPALFGAGLLDTIRLEDVGGMLATPVGGPPVSTIPGRFGWQATALSVRDQTARAFAREMGLTSADISSDDCTPTETACLQQPNGGSPEVSAELFDAILSFQRWLAVPASPTPHSPADPGAQTFTELGCVACHRPQWPVTLTEANGATRTATIAPYTDLRRHNLGTGLADETVAGKKVTSEWRTAPLWGLGYRMSLERFPTFLHDGRARSVEEAILWHNGEATGARVQFEHLSEGQRKAFAHWLETL